MTVVMHAAPTFERLFDLEKIQNIQDAFAKTAGVASIITDPEGNPITRPSNFRRICRDMIRASDLGLATCKASDAMIGRACTHGPIIKQCLNIGLWDAGVSMVVSGHHIATWLIGQVRTNPIGRDTIAACADRVGVDEVCFLSALEEVPAMPYAQFEQVAQTLYIIANELSDQAYQKFNKEQILAEKRKAEQALVRQNEYLAALHETALGMFTRRELDQVLSSIVQRAAKLTGIPNGLIYLHDISNKEFTVRAACGKCTRLLGQSLSMEKGICGQVWDTAAPVIVDDYNTWPRKTDQYPLSFITSAIGVPLTSGSRIEGGLTLCHHEPGNALSQDACHIMEQFAELATLATDNAHLFDSLNQELEQRIRLENEQKEMTAMLRQSQKLEAIGTLAGGIAHDFNNILFPVMGFSEMLLNEIPETSPMHHQIQTIFEGALRAKDLVQQILTFSRQAEQELSPLKIQLILKEVLKFARASLPSTIKIKADISNGVREVLADPTMIHQLSMNLITNALHAMETDGGILKVRLCEQEVQPGQAPLPDMVSGCYACLEVSDTGIGMGAETMTRIFEPYFTSKPKGKGTGLGLAVVHGVVKSLGGRIKVHSREGIGSSFYVYLPVMVTHSSKQKTCQVTDMLPNGHERILLVDDEKPVLTMLEQMLLRSGYEVTLKDSGQEALEDFKRHPHAFDLIITDMTMPGMTGDKFILQTKKIRPEIPVILTTGFSEKVAGERTCSVKPDRILMKPVAKKDLLTAIRSLLDPPQKN